MEQISVQMLITTIISVLLYCAKGFELEPRIYGGEDAAPNQFPFLVSIRHPIHFCDGVIINKTWVITAAHCLSILTHGARILVGTNQRYAGGKECKIKRWIIHKDFQSTYIRGVNDIGLIELLDELEFSDSIKPIAIGDAKAGSKCIAAGRGWTNINERPRNVKFIQLSIIDSKKCKKLSRDHNEGYYVGSKTICTLVNKGKGICHGDSGGPLICDGKLAGVASYGVMPCAKGYPDIYTRVSQYKGWIKEMMKTENPYSILQQASIYYPLYNSQNSLK